MLSLPADGSEALSDFTELGLYGLPDAAGTFAQGLVEPDPVQLGYNSTEMVLAATNSTTKSVLTEFGCFSSPSGTSNSKPQFVVDLGDYLVIDISDLDISAGETIDLSGLGSVPVAETSGDPYSVFQAAMGCDTGQTLGEDTLNTPVPVNCVDNSTAVPLIQASVENSSGAPVPGVSVITPTPAAPTACGESAIPPLEPPANNGTTVATTSTMPAPSSTTTTLPATTTTTSPASNDTTMLRHDESVANADLCTVSGKLIQQGCGSAIAQPQVSSEPDGHGGELFAVQYPQGQNRG